MSWSSSSVTYGYTVTLSMEDIVNAIISKLVGDNDEWEFDGDNLIIYQKDRTCCRVWHCNATLEDPEEYEVELGKSIDDVDVTGEILDALHRLKREDINVWTEIDEEEKWEFPEYDPYDDNDAYDRWRDAYYDREYAERGSEEE